MQIIDPHLHLFDLAQGEYFWLKPENPPEWPDKEKIHRNYRQEDLTLPTPYKLAGFVHIEAGFDNQQPERELAFLAQSCSVPYRSIAFADLTSSNFQPQVSGYQGNESFIGIRHILDDDATTVLAHPNSRSNLAYLANNQLIFEAQLSLLDSEGVALLSEHLAALPELVVIINHAGFPPVEQSPQAQLNLWHDSLRKLSLYPNCAIKCSGWEMQQRNWEFHWARTVILSALDVFGPNRVMLASNFPVSELGLSYGELWAGYLTQLEMANERLQQLAYENAKAWYRFAD